MSATNCPADDMNDEGTNDGDFHESANGASSAIPFIADVGKNPISLLYEYCSRVGRGSPIIKYQLVNESRFIASVVVDGEEYTGSPCAKKREAKSSCCQVAWDALMLKGKASIRSDMMREISSGMQLHERIQHLLYSEFAVTCQGHSELSATDTVISGIFMLDAVACKCFLVSWATGNKCLQGRSIDLEGRTVNDSHAEILCRRGLMRFLYQQVLLFMRNEELSIFELKLNKLTLRSSLSFHLFISSAPCGDGRVFSFTSEDTSLRGSAHKPIFEKGKGLLRTKIDRGEGTVPIPEEISRQTIDGIFGNERMRTMSCSDKILKWNTLGLQGCLLSTFVNPIYLSSISVEHLFHFGHLSRSLCCRVATAFEVPAPYKLSHPHIESCNKIPPRTAKRSSSLAANWNISDGSVEILNAATGKVYRSSRPSRLCKRSMFELYNTVVQKISAKGTTYKIAQTYLQVKQLTSKGYVEAQTNLYLALLENGCGRWLSKPPEEKAFSLA